MLSSNTSKMYNNVNPIPSKNEKSSHQRNISDELDVFEAARYFSSANENFTGPNSAMAADVMVKKTLYMKHGVGRLSLDMPNKRGFSTSLKAMMMENQKPLMIKKDKKPSSPGGKLAHFLNTLFNQATSKKNSKSKSTTQSVKDEDESPSGWRRKRRSSISHFRSGNSNTNVSDTKSVYSTSATQPPYKTTSYRDLFRSSAAVITKIPMNKNHNKIENFKFKNGCSEKKMCLGNGLLEKVRVCDVKHDDDHHYHHHKYDPMEEVRGFKRFINGDEDGDSDSSSDLFELRNFDLSCYSSGLPVYETTHMDSIKRGAPISS